MYGKYIIKEKALSAMLILSFLSASAAFAVQQKTQEECVDAVNNCYDNVWWIPDWGCDVLYRQCMKNAI